MSLDGSTEMAMTEIELKKMNHGVEIQTQVITEILAYMVIRG